MPGLIYVAILRVQHPNDLQVRKFKSSQLLKPPPGAVSVCDNTQEECDDLTSCVNQNLNNDLFSVCDYGEDFGEEDPEAPEALSVDSYPDDDNDIIVLGAVFLALDEEESQVSEPTDDFDIVQLLEKPKSTRASVSFRKEKNAAIAKVLMDSVQQLTLLSLSLWYE